MHGSVQIIYTIQESYNLSVLYCVLYTREEG